MSKMKMKSQKPNGKNGPKPKFSTEELNAALDYATDHLERVSIRFFLWGETAIQVKDRGKLDQLPEVSLAVLVTEWNGIRERQFRTMMEHFKGKWKEGEGWFKFYHGEIPIRVKVIKKYRDFFKNPDIIHYNYDQYYIPNQFEKFRKMRFMVK